MTDVLTLPEGGGIDAPEAAEGGQPTTLQEAKLAVRTAMAEALALPADAVGAAAAVARLVAQHGSDVDLAADWLADRMAVRAAGEPDPGAWLRLLYEAAGAALEDGRPGEAITLLCTLAAAPGGRADGWIGLAVCGARLACYEDALVLALECRGLRPAHPRPSCIAGLCELERGNRRAAQAYLASAARLARGRREFSEDLRQAQRTLLLMHLA